MRKSLPQQGRLDCPSVEELTINVNCRDAIIPILVAMKHVYADARLSASILKLVEEDVSRNTNPDIGRQGMDYWQILVLTALRLGCDYDTHQRRPRHRFVSE
jgi:hypothetical protein